MNAESERDQTRRSPISANFLISFLLFVSEASLLCYSFFRSAFIRVNPRLTLTARVSGDALVKVPETHAQAIDKIGRDGKSQG